MSRTLANTAIMTIMMMMILLRSEKDHECFTLGYLHLHLDNRDGSGRGACHQQRGEVRQPITRRKETETSLSFYMRISQTSTIDLLKFCSAICAKKKTLEIVENRLWSKSTNLAELISKHETIT